MVEYFLRLSDFLRSYLSEDLIFVGMTPLLISFFTAPVSIFYSIFRINREMKRDGIEPPTLHYLNIIFYFDALASSRKSIAKKIKSEQDSGNKKHSVFLCVTLIQPYIKPIDRFFARCTGFCAVTFLILSIIHMWLYPS